MGLLRPRRRAARGFEPRQPRPTRRHPARLRSPPHRSKGRHRPRAQRLRFTHRGHRRPRCARGESGRRACMERQPRMGRGPAPPPARPASQRPQTRDLRLPSQQRGRHARHARPRTRRSASGRAKGRPALRSAIHHHCDGRHNDPASPLLLREQLRRAAQALRFLHRIAPADRETRHRQSYGWRFLRKYLAPFPHGYDRSRRAEERLLRRLVRRRCRACHGSAAHDFGGHLSLHASHCGAHEGSHRWHRESHRGNLIAPVLGRRLILALSPRLRCRESPQPAVSQHHQS